MSHLCVGALESRAVSHLSVKITPFNAVVSFAKEPYKRDDILQKRPMFRRRYVALECWCTGTRAASLEGSHVPHVLQCVAVCCRVLPCVAVCCSVLQCAAVCCRAGSLQGSHVAHVSHTDITRTHTHTHTNESCPTYPTHTCHTYE